MTSDGTTARIGALGAGEEWFKPWRTIEGTADAPSAMPEVRVLLEGFFEHRRFLDLLRHFVVFEDAGGGATIGYLEGRHAITQIAHRWTERDWEVTIGRPLGDAAQAPASRSVRLLLRGTSSPAAVDAMVGDRVVDPPIAFDERTWTVAVGPFPVRRGDDARVRLIGTAWSLRADADRTAEAWFEMLKAFRLPALVKRAIYREQAAIEADPIILDRWADSLSAAQRQALLDLLDLWRDQP